MTHEERLSDEQERAAVIKQAEREGRAGIGEPGLESASGRDRAGTELPRNFGTNQGDVYIASVAPPPGSIDGSRVGSDGDPTGELDDESQAQEQR